MITPPGLARLGQDYNIYSQANSSYVELKASWMFGREYPLGSEEANGDKAITLSLDSLQPFVDLI